MLLAACHKTHYLFHFFNWIYEKVKDNSLTSIKYYFCTNRGIPWKTSRLNFYFKKFQKTGQFEDKRSVRPKETNVCTEDRGTTLSTALWNVVWSCISATVVGNLVKIDGTLNIAMYFQILIHHAIPSGKHVFGNSFIFQHELFPKNT